MVCALLAAGCANPLDAFGDDESAPAIGSESAEGSSDGDGASDGDDDSIDARLDSSGITASFRDGTCGFEVPEGWQPRCGTVSVPMDWETGEGTVDLAVAVFEAVGADSAGDPVIYLDGGPGSHALDTAQFAVESLIDPLTARGDLILFDQRGAGLSEPRLDCPETAELTRTIEDDPGIGEDEATGMFHDALGDCRKRLIGTGIDLTDYNSINNAYDVEAIRVALGYESWNLYGVSYGTKLGLEVLRRHPDGVRSAILDSVYPPQVDSVLENPGTFVESYQRVLQACAVEPACSAAGDLGERIRDVVAGYEAEPVRVEVRDWITGEVDDVFVTGETIVDVIVGSLYSPSQFTDIPELIEGLEQGRTGEIATFLGQDRTTERFFTTGMFFSIACHEEISFADPDTVAAAVPDDPFGLRDRFDFASNTGNLAFGTCAAFENGQAPDTSNTAVASDVPTLLMAGVYDPVTPVSWAEAAAETLSNANLVIAPHGSHGVSTDECGIGIVLDFLQDLNGDLDTACLAEDELRFLPGDGQDAEVPLEAVGFDLESYGVRIESVRPTDWDVGTLFGDQYRRNSFLDPTQLYQLAGDRFLGEVLEEFIQDEQAVTLSQPEPFSGLDAIGPVSAETLSRTWQRRTARAETVAVEWFQREDGDNTVYVVLVSTVAEQDRLLGTVMLPALESIDVAAL